MLKVVMLTLISTVILLLISAKYIHILQLEGYKCRELLKWTTKNINENMKMVLILFIIPVIVQFIFYTAVKNSIAAVWSGIVIYAILGFLYFIKIKKTPSKTPLVFTNRVKRLYVSMVIVLLLATFGFIELGNVLPDSLNKLFLYLSSVLLPVFVCAAAVLVSPVEHMIKMHFYNDAKNKINKYNKLIKIGITGSYGKTSTKFILGKILEQKYKVLVTPNSYNTPMGVAKTIREKLNDDTEVFVAEMGARHIGDIKELCDLVHPKYGIITSIGKQHLETFKTIENVANTKYELIESLPDDGIAFFPDDGSFCTKLYNKTNIEKALYGLNNKNLSITADNIEVQSNGSRFVLRSCDGQECICETSLLGIHNILNIVGCAEIARKLGLSMQQISDGIRNIEPVPHRLQLIPTANGLTVIDDAFNSNPAGTRAALDVLRQFKGRKIVITPGMVELGSEQEHENYKFGQNLAHSADIVMLVGEKITEPIAEGLFKEGFNKDMAFKMHNLNEATKKLQQISRIGDVVLFENDLPDNYDE